MKSVVPAGKWDGDEYVPQPTSTPCLKQIPLWRSYRHVRVLVRPGFSSHSVEELSFSHGTASPMQVPAPGVTSCLPADSQVHPSNATQRSRVWTWTQYGGDELHP